LCEGPGAYKETPESREPAPQGYTEVSLPRWLRREALRCWLCLCPRHGFLRPCTGDIGGCGKRRRNPSKQMANGIHLSMTALSV
jgi:hypothetical protein